MNPNHDPTNGQFTFAGGGGKTVHSQSQKHGWWKELGHIEPAQHATATTTTETPNSMTGTGKADMKPYHEKVAQRVPEHMRPLVTSMAKLRYHPHHVERRFITLQHPAHRGK